MIKNSLRLLCACALIFSGVSINIFAQKETPPAGTAPKPFVFPKAEDYALPNGMKVTLVQYGSVPKVAIQAYVRAGALNEKTERRWISDMVAAMLKEGTKTRSAEQIAAAVADMGGSLNSWSDYDKMTVNGEVLSEFDTEFLALLADVLMNPNFQSQDLERRRADILRNNSVARTRAGTIAQEKFYSVIYGSHPYGSYLSTDETVKGYTLAQVQNFYDENFGAQRTHLYVVGRFDKAKVKSQIEKSFGGWKKGAEPIRNVPTVAAGRSLNLIDRPGAPQSTIILGMPAVSPSDDDFIKVSVMDAILGGSFDSRITANIRENKGYTYSPYSQVFNRYKTGYWYETADVTTASTGASLKEILYEIDRLQKEPPTEAEMQGIKNYLTGIYVLQNSTRTGVIAQLENMNYNELDKNYIDSYVQKISAVTAQDVTAMAKKYLQPDKMTIVIVGDKAVIAEQIKPYEK